MIFIKDMFMLFHNPAEYIKKEYRCSCGKTHSIKTDIISVGIGVKPNFVDNHTLIVCDENTLKASFGIDGQKFVLGDSVTSADIKYVNFLINNIPTTIKTLCALGSGSINDITRYTANQKHLKFISIATAPSMDGYLSGVSPIIFENGLKISVPAKSALEVYCDLDILKQAPLPLILAGLGDILGKHTSLIDWKIANLVTDCFYCREIADLVKFAVDICQINAAEISQRTLRGIKTLTDALLLCGIAMDLSEFSRPASGCEHTLAHYLENEELQGRVYGRHGDFVGVSMLIYARLLNIFFSKKRMPKDKKLYEKFMDNWDSIKNDVEELFENIDSIEHLMKAAGCKTNLKEIGLNAQSLQTALNIVNPTAPKYTSIQLFRDFGVDKLLISDFFTRYF